METSLAKNNTPPSHSLQIMPTNTVALQLENKRFGDIVKSVPNSVEKIMNAPLVCDLVRQVGAPVLKEFIEGQLVFLAGQMNVAHNLQTWQKDFVAETLLGTFSTESLADFILVFKRGAIGYYGNDYHKLDAATIMSWMGKHIEEKSMYRERDATTAKIEEEKDVKDPDYKAFKKRLEEERKIQKDGKLTEFKRRQAEAKVIIENIGYKPPAADEVRKRELHIKWIRENYDSISGKPKPGWMAENDWLKKQNSKP